MALEDFYEKLTFVEKRTIEDGLGSFEEAYVDGATFMGSVNTDNSIEVRVAQQQGVKSIYTITTNKKTTLKFNDVVRKDNKYYRVTSEEIESPAIADIDIRQVTAESFTLPS